MATTKKAPAKKAAAKKPAVRAAGRLPAEVKVSLQQSVNRKVTLLRGVVNRLAIKGADPATIKDIRSKVDGLDKQLASVLKGLKVA